MGQNPLLSLILIPSPPTPRNNPLHKMRKGKTAAAAKQKYTPCPQNILQVKEQSKQLVAPLPVASSHPCSSPRAWLRSGRAAAGRAALAPCMGLRALGSRASVPGGEHGTVPAAGDFKCHALMQGVQIPCKAPLSEQSSSQVPWGQLSAPQPGTQRAACSLPQPQAAPVCPPPCTCRTRLSPFSLVSRPMQSCRSRLTKPLVPTSPVPGRAASPLVHALVVLNQTLSAFSFLLPPFGVAAPSALQPSLHGSQLPGASS